MTGPVCREFKIPNETSHLATVREAVREVVAESSFPKDELNRLMLAVDESVTNVMEHAYEHDLEGEMSIEITLSATGSEFVARIRDWGSSFDPTQVPAPNLSEHVKDGRRHGLGIFLVRRIMDEVTYTSSPDGCNELRLAKRVRTGEDKKSADASAAGEHGAASRGAPSPG